MARVDQGEGFPVLPQVGLADGEAEHVEPVRQHFDKIHTVNVRAAGPRTAPSSPGAQYAQGALPPGRTARCGRHRPRRGQARLDSA